MLALIRNSTNKIVEAEVISNLSKSVVEATDDVWLEFQRGLILKVQSTGNSSESFPEHLHWRWSQNARSYEGRSGYEFLAVRCEERIQGMMLLDYTRIGRLPKQASLPLVYVDYLSAAPWNLHLLENSPEFRGVGRLLITIAEAKSRELGFQGRLGLHSLPQAEGFYRRLPGMVDLGSDSQYYGLSYFEGEQETEEK